MSNDEGCSFTLTIDSKKLKVSGIIAQMIHHILEEAEVVDKCGKGRITLHYKLGTKVQIEHTYHK